MIFEAAFQIIGVESVAFLSGFRVGIARDLISKLHREHENGLPIPGRASFVHKDVLPITAWKQLCMRAIVAVLTIP